MMLPGEWGARLEGLTILIMFFKPCGVAQLLVRVDAHIHTGAVLCWGWARLPPKGHAARRYVQFLGDSRISSTVFLADGVYADVYIRAAACDVTLWLRLFVRSFFFVGLSH